MFGGYSNHKLYKPLPDDIFNRIKDMSVRCTTEEIEDCITFFFFANVGYRYVFTFENGLSVVVLKKAGSAGNVDELWEIFVLNKDREPVHYYPDEIERSCRFDGHSVGFLCDEEVYYVCKIIAEYRDRFGHI